MTLDEKIEVMQAFKRGDEVQVDKGYYGCWALTTTPSWNWADNNYRIQPRGNKRVIMEKWLCSSDEGFTIRWGDDAYFKFWSGLKKVKRLDVEEVTL